MTATVVITRPVRFTAEVRGRRGLGLLQAADVPRLFAHAPPSGGCACWTIPAARVPDVLAAADLVGVRVIFDEQEMLP